MDGYSTRVTLERTGLYGELAVTAHNLVGISSVIAAWEVRGPSSESVPVWARLEPRAQCLQPSMAENRRTEQSYEVNARAPPPPP